MKSNLYTKFAVLVLGLSVTATATYAGSNVNHRQIKAQPSAVISPVSYSANNRIDDGAKTENTVRVGIAGVKTGSVGEGINAQELAGAIQNTLGEYLKGSRVELVPLEAKVAAGIDAEAQEKQCAYVLYATVSHKKGGGGGFGMFKAIAPVLTSVVPMAGVGGMIAGSVASTVINTASSATTNVKKKDELTLDIKLQNGAAVALTKQFKAKAKSEGEDIISPMIEQAAQAIVDAVAAK